jgi:translation initiation factor IF-2
MRRRSGCAACGVSGISAAIVGVGVRSGHVKLGRRIAGIRDRTLLSKVRGMIFVGDTTWERKRGSKVGMQRCPR